MTDTPVIDPLSGAPAVPASGDPAPSVAPAAVDPAPAVVPPSGAAASWLDGLPDDLKADPSVSRFQGKPLDEFVRSHLEVRKTIGMDRIVVPAADAPADQWDAVWSKLGRPDSADAYDVPTLEGDDGQYAAAFRPVAHKLGLSAAQAKGLAEWQNGMIGQAEAARADADKAGLAALKTAWGAEYDSRFETAKAGVNAFADILPPALVAEGSEMMGRQQWVQFWYEVGQRLGEHGRPFGDLPPGIATPDDARAALRAKQSDAGWREKVSRGDLDAIEERDRLMAAARGQARAAPAKRA